MSLRRAVAPVTFSLAATLIVLVGAAHTQSAEPEAPPYVPTPMPLVERMLSMAEVSSEDVVYDLGSGDGRLVIAAASRGARAVGVEYEPSLVERSWLNADSAGVRSRVSFLRQDLFETDLRDATVVILYLGAEFNLRLRPRLLEQLQPGTRVVSHGFHMGDWQPDATETVGSGASRATLFSWTVPAVVDGFWSLQIDGVGPIGLEIRQDFQRLSGTGSGPNTLRELRGKVSGELISFELLDGDDTDGPSIEFIGRLIAGRLVGTVEGLGDSGGRGWVAVRYTDPSRAPTGQR